ncbi:DUF397 domain-containing protein [Thermopolyspora sp. NPDC052614]|uniref:DUF397 domain-containing protein n=1 Tax=Thermopolyspora sp. NPDC052614 TaxID=3155682 RepID=UPI00341AFDB3
MDLTDPVWRKSSHSGSENVCVEAAMVWRKSTYSGGENECVEAAACSKRTAAHKAEASRLVVLRDSKDPDGPRLYFTPAEWKAFRLDVCEGKFDGLSR